MLLGLLLLGGLGFLVGAALGAAFGTNGPRLTVVLLLAPSAALAYFAIAYLAAPASPSAHDCFECTNTLGRSFDPIFVVVLALNVIGWWIGAAAGAGARALYRRSASTRLSAT